MIKTLILMMCVSTLALAGCQNTVQGFGQDMEKAGKKIQGEPANTTTVQKTSTTYSSSTGYGDTY